MTEIEFVNPPAEEPLYAEFVGAIVARPGVWAILPSDGLGHAKSVGNHVKSGRLVAFRGFVGQFETRLQKMAGRPGRYRIYVRYIPHAPAADAAGTPTQEGATE